MRSLFHLLLYVIDQSRWNGFSHHKTCPIKPAPEKPNVLGSHDVRDSPNTSVYQCCLPGSQNSQSSLIVSVVFVLRTVFSDCTVPFVSSTLANVMSLPDIAQISPYFKISPIHSAQCKDSLLDLNMFKFKYTHTYAHTHIYTYMDI